VTGWGRGETAAAAKAKSETKMDMTLALSFEAAQLRAVHAAQAAVDARRRLQAETAAALVALLLAVWDRAFKGES
jgi:hypothetical protein